MTKHRSAVERQAEILHAARTSFIEKGYDRSRMDDIAKLAGISKGGVYFHFNSKAEIFEALVDREFEASMAVMAAAAADPGSTLTDRLTTLGAHYFRAFGEDKDFSRFAVVMGEMTIRNETVGRKILHMHTRYLELIEEMLEKAIEAGEIRAVDPRSTAVVLKAIIDGLETSHAMGWRPDDMAVLLSNAMDVVVGGLGRRE